MSGRLTRRLDECLTALLRAGATVEECLRRFPEHSDRLRPLVEAAEEVRRIPSPSCSEITFRAGKNRMLGAVAAKRPSLEPAAPRARIGVRLAPAARAVLLVAAALALVVAGSLLLQRPPEPATARSASLNYLYGPVQVLPSGGEAWRQAVAGESLSPGARVRTGGDAYAELVFFEGSSTWLEPQSELTLLDMRRDADAGRTAIALHQSVGATYSSVRAAADACSSFSVETPAALAAVQGTEFRVEVETDGTTTVAVADGKVAVAAQNVTVQLAGGEETSVRPSETPSAARTVEGSVERPVPPAATPTPEAAGPDGGEEPQAPTETPGAPTQARSPTPSSALKPTTADTPVPSTATVTPSATGTAEPTEGRTPTPEPSPTSAFATATATPTAMATPTTRTATPTPLATPTTLTTTPTPLATPTGKATPVPTLTRTPLPTAVPIPHTESLAPVDGYDQNSAANLSTIDKVHVVTASDGDRWQTEPGYFTSYEFSDINMPASATVASVIIYCEHYEEEAFGAGGLEWIVGLGWQNEPGATRLAYNPAPFREGEYSEGVDGWDVSEVVNTPGLLDQMQFVVRNNDATGKKTYVNSIYAVVEWLES
jgi:hypothetical protein